MTKHFCDRCDVEITTQTFIHHVYRDESLNRLGVSKPQNKPGIILCDECSNKLDMFLAVKREP